MPNESFIGATISLMLRDVPLNDRVSSVLQLYGCSVLHTDSPDAAMAAQRHESQRISLLITDDTLDPASGASLFHRMEVSQSDLMVLYISQDPPGHAKIAGFSQIHFLSIPFADADLLDAAAHLLRSVIER